MTPKEAILSLCKQPRTIDQLEKKLRTAKLVRSVGRAIGYFEAEALLVTLMDEGLLHVHNRRYYVPKHVANTPKPRKPKLNDAQKRTLDMWSEST